jgi:hypothetical protein
MSFGWLDSFRVGQWLSLRSFLLRERKNVPARVRTIREELERIGFITVLFKKTPLEDPSGVTTEERAGFFVSSEFDEIFYNVNGHSGPVARPPYKSPSLLKLLQAYIALGGNPLDISLFLQPDIALYVQDSEKIKNQPYGGYISATSSFEGESHFNYTTSGSNPLIKSRSNRTKSKSTEGGQWEEDISRARLFANREIMTKRNRIEENIIKLCDLREQLYSELLDTIRVSLWGTFDPSSKELNFLKVPGKDDPKDILEVKEHHLFSIIAKIDGIIFDTKEIEGKLFLDFDSKKITERITAYDKRAGPRLNIFTDDPQEANTAY